MRDMKEVSNFKILVNKVSGWAMMVVGAILTYYSVTTLPLINEIGAFFPIFNTLTSIALIFLGIYILKVERWAVILAGAYGMVALITRWWSLGFPSSVQAILMTLADVLFVINWIIFKNDK